MNPTRKTDEAFTGCFPRLTPFQSILTKREDSELRDKYDHNAFCYSGQPTEDELWAALAYQKERGDASSNWKDTSPWPMHSAWSAKRP